MRLVAKLGAELLPRAAASGSGRISGLRHEAVNDPVEYLAVIEALPRKLLDAPRGSGLSSTVIGSMVLKSLSLFNFFPVWVRLS
jgi:hypothetical protein